MKKYKPSIDIPKLARKYGTLKPSELSRAILQDKGIRKSQPSIYAWLHNHPNERNKLSIEIKNASPRKKLHEIPIPYAKLTSQYFGSMEIINLETIEKAREELKVIEEQFWHEIWEKTGEEFARRFFTEKTT